MEDRHTRYNETLEYLSEQEAAGNVLILQPKESVDISRVEKDLDKLRALYEKGYQDAVERIEDIRRFLSEPVRS